jgi:hypothetical protein
MRRSAAAAAARVVPFTLQSHPSHHHPDQRPALLRTFAQLQPFQRAAVVAFAAQLLALNAPRLELPSAPHRVMQRAGSAIAAGRLHRRVKGSR